MTQRPFVALPFIAALALSACAAPVSGGPAEHPGPSAVPGGAIGAAAATITPEDMYSRIAFLASDAMRGRNTPSRELNIAAQALVDHHRRLGLEPAGENGTYLQWYPFPLRGLNTTGTRLNVVGSRGTQELRLGRDFFTRGATPADVDAPPVFVGQGTAEAFGAEGSLRDRVAVATLPGTWTAAFRTERNRQAAAAQRAGAAAIVHVLDATWTADSIAKYAEAAARPFRTLGGGDPGFPGFFVTQEAARRMFAAGNVNFAQASQTAGARPVPLAGVRLVAGAPLREIDRETAPNVVAVLRGSDPTLRDEYVVLSAHFDHVGVGRPDATGDSIYNGADDDASGTAALMEIAEALASMPVRPRRSVVFLHVSGEEKGLLGSQWYSDHPTLPLQQTVANLNLDMISRNTPDTIVVIGKEYSTLGATTNEVGARHPELNLVAGDDVWPEERFFFRSDHFHFARKEVPSIFFFNGVHDDYHRPSDHVEKVDTDKAARVARLVLYITNDVANADGRPQWDPQGLEEVRALVR
jgi:Zn-dependent M28 family amino/carboxypeptidase